MAETQSQDAIALLKQDHRTVEDLFADFEKASGDGRKEKLAAQICLELSVHAAIEDAAKLLIAEISAGSGAGDDFFDSKVKVLQEEIEHHVEEEEKRMEGLFAQARKAGLDMDALGEQLAARKAELTESYKTTGIPKPELTTMDEVSA